jgi:hypothetical protein
MRGSDETRLDALFGAYRRACEAPDPSANFMPGVWDRIESRKTFAFSFRRMANAFATAAVAFSIAFGVYLSIPRATAPLQQSYIDALAEANAPDTPEIVGPVAIDLTPR